MPSWDLMYVIHIQIYDIKIVSFIRPALIILNQMQKLHSMQFLQMQIEYFLLALQYLYNLFQEIIYSLAIYFAFSKIVYLLFTVNSVIEKH